MTDTHYHVSWEIDLWANSLEDAARKALKIQRDPDSIATVFRVREAGSDNITTIDLEDQTT